MTSSRLTDSIDAYRAAALASNPAPSAELLTRLDARILREVAATSQPGVSAGAVQWAGTPAPVPAPTAVRAAFAWLAGLGLVTKLVIGMSVAAVATTGAGVAGVLPGEAQRVFDTVLPGLSPERPPVIADDEVEPTEPTDDFDSTPESTTDPTTEPSPTEEPGNGANDPDGMPGQSGENGQGDPNPAPGPGNNGNGNQNPGEGNQGNGGGFPTGGNFPGGDGGTFTPPDGGTFPGGTGQQGGGPQTQVNGG